ncbi:DNA-directed RNA polymerase [Pullulanibacillus pueri]|uniref:RNA polymerase sigma factor SigS n=1 Tax=Pullulanibacillus pueri TaxID=1437324 RepID=A0A8J3A127_9BACL|nr:sigma-70 family RNA polymerase sigma factor [Pullulanibacillus pueri]MBM7680560.1 DNA-directed RNA polymerase [Pullulanibacillus pueri]GGH88430.1 RNA polymerase sigma factor SigS [Pullulanibacillus pueri]
MDTAFEDIAQQFEPLIRKYLLELHLLADYQEMHQVGLIALWEAWRKYQPEKGPFPAFAQAVVRGRLLTEIKKQKQFSDHHTFQENLPEPPIAPKDGVLNIEALLKLSVLSERERLWLHEAIFLEKKTKIIADEQAVSVNTIRSWKKAVLKKLRKLIKAEEFL